MICGVKETEIIKNINKNDLFKIICRIKKINYEEIIGNLINKIEESAICDKDAYIYTQEIWDNECFHIVKEERVLIIDESFLWEKEEAINFFIDDINKNCEIELELKSLWVETTQKEKEVIQIANECNLDEIRIEIM